MIGEWSGGGGELNSAASQACPPVPCLTFRQEDGFARIMGWRWGELIAVVKPDTGLTRWEKLPSQCWPAILYLRLLVNYYC